MNNSDNISSTNSDPRVDQPRGDQPTPSPLLRKDVRNDKDFKKILNYTDKDSDNEDDALVEGKTQDEDPSSLFDLLSNTGKGVKNTLKNTTGLVKDTLDDGLGGLNKVYAQVDSDLAGPLKDTLKPLTANLKPLTDNLDHLTDVAVSTTNSLTPGSLLDLSAAEQTKKPLDPFELLKEGLSKDNVKPASVNPFETSPLNPGSTNPASPAPSTPLPFNPGSTAVKADNQNNSSILNPYSPQVAATDTKKPAYKGLASLVSEAETEKNRKLAGSLDKGVVDQDALIAEGDQIALRKRIVDPNAPIIDPAQVAALNAAQTLTTPLQNTPNIQNKSAARQLGNPNLAALDTDATLLASRSNDSRNVAHSRSEFKQENQDLAAVNPALAGLNNQTPILGKGEEVAKQVNIPRLTKEVVDQIVKAIQVLQTTGKTDTIITLKSPPILENAVITLSSFDSAKGEFNISFSNLSPDAKNLIDQRLVQESLRGSLADKGYVVHILSTTTLQETPQQQQQQQNQQDDSDQSRQRQRDAYPDEEEER